MVMLGARHAGDTLAERVDRTGVRPNLSLNVKAQDVIDQMELIEERYSESPT